MTSIQTGPQQITNNPTPTLGHVPLATAMNSAPPMQIPPMNTPPQTPASTHGGLHSATSSVSGSVLGKRDSINANASESDKEDGNKAKKRRVAPTLIGPSGTSTEPKKDGQP